MNLDMKVNDSLKSFPFCMKYRVYRIDYQQEVHAHDGYELYVVHSGTGGFLCDEYEIPMEENRIILFHGEQFHKPIANRDMVFVRTVIHFSLEYLSGNYPADICGFLQGTTSQPFIATLKWKDATEFNQIVDGLWTEYQKRPFLFQWSIELGLHRLLLFLCRLSKSVIFNAELITAPPAPSSGHLIQEVCTYLSANYQNPLDPTELCQRFHVSKYHLCHLFKKQTGMNMSQYLNKMRLQQARYLVLHSNYSITEIASRVGLDNPSYFSKIFKKQTGNSPTRLRRQYLRNQAQVTSNIVAEQRGKFKP